MRAARFVGVGALGFAVQLAALHALTQAGVHYSLAAALAVELAILQNFGWHERWTWGDRRAASRSAIAARLVRFNAASGVVSILGNVVLTVVFVELARLPLLVANTLAVVTLSAVNYAVADRLVFQAAKVRKACAGCGAGLLVLSAASVEAADLKPDAVGAWNRYVASVEARLAQDAQEAARSNALKRRLRTGEVIVQDVEMQTADVVSVPGGMIHHWRGYVFIPGITVADLVAAGQDPTGRNAHRQEDVLESRVLSRDGDRLRLFLKLQRRNIVTVAYNTEHLVSYRHVGPGHVTSRSVSTKIAEIDNVGTPAERERAVGQDRGFLWRLNSYWRYQAVEGGVLVELESLTLSRDIPWGFATIARPLVDRVARESVARTLDSMRQRFASDTTN